MAGRAHRASNSQPRMQRSFASYALVVVQNAEIFVRILRPAHLNMPPRTCLPLRLSLAVRNTVVRTVVLHVHVRFLRGLYASDHQSIAA
jgi:hypothetical protein